MRGKTRYRLPKEMILRGRDNFQMLFDGGRGLRSGNLVLKYRVVEDRSPSRVATAFIVAKKHGRAVDRNRARRLMREVWRLAYPEVAEKLPENVFVHLALIWAGPPAQVKSPEFWRIREDMLKGVEKVVARLPNVTPGKPDR
ncbi:MAG: ribonuclease P protein component [Ignavibacteriae bacterium]|nr:ribonuclease P protein component [Ignavibacteriota bacterium]MCB9216736.1 ribonuclease P protein component [Ignavibacteria bacterium]